MADKHVCKHCGAPRSGHDCPVAKRRIDKKSDDDFVIMAAAVALTTPAAEVERLFPADPAPAFDGFEDALPQSSDFGGDAGGVGGGD